MSDSIDPEHYRDHPSGGEMIEIAERWSFNRGSALKYLWRCGKKGDAIEDLEKATWYLRREIRLLEEQGSN